ncbi:unnamed protein product [Dicrocoelium dendriticum]|nr:unnamed protein product [Dicrocoelium dendriticum]
MCEIGTLVESSRPDVLAFTETWLFSDILDSEMCMPGYTLLRADRASCCRGGGVALYVKSTLTISRTYPFSSPDVTAEALAVDVCASFTQFKIVLVYRSPESTSSRLIDFIRTHTTNRCLVMGDFNVPEVDWRNFCTAATGRFSNDLLDLSLQASLHQFVQSPTRFMEGQKPSILDLIFAKSLDFVRDVVYAAPLGSSDHVCLLFKCALSRGREECMVRRPNIWRADFQAIRAKAANQLCIMSEDDTVQVAWDKFKSFLCEISLPHIPISARNKVGAKPPWFDSEARRMLSRRSRCWRTYVSAPSESTHHRYRSVRNACKQHLRAARLRYELALARSASTNPKRFFGYVKRRCNANPPIPVLFGPDGTEVSTDQAKACLLAEQYARSFVHESPLPNIQLQAKIPLDSFLMDLSISEAQVLKLLRDLNPTKAAGIDALHPKLLYELAGFLCKPIKCIFEKSLRSCSLPADWRDAIVCPIFKKGDKHLPENYRPVSLTSVLVKVLEKLVRDALEKHLAKFSLLNPSQHGFRRGHSCLTNMLVARECWAEAVDQGQAVDVLFIDFSKAFDTVPHCRLLFKLESYGVSGQVLKWISAFLEGRQMSVRVGSGLSFRQAVLSGVPQGSVLGPLLFALYVNDLPEKLKVPSLMFADDLKFWNTVSGSVGPTALQTALDKLWEWSELWQLPVNLAKCSVLRIGSSTPTTSYVLGGNVLRQVTEQTDLGISLSSDFKSSENWINATRKGFRMLWMIRRSFGIITNEMFVILFSAFVRPYLEYCVQACPPCLVRDKMTLERVLRVGTKMVQGLRHLSYPDRLLRLQMFSLHYRRLRGDLILTYRILTNKIGPDLTGLFQPAQMSSLRGHPLKLHKPRSDHVRADVRLSRRVIDSWNALPSEVVLAPTVKEFEHRLDALGLQFQTFPFSS